MTESIMEAIRIRTPYTIILYCITLSLTSAIALLLCHQLFILPSDVSVSFSSHLHGGKILTSLMSSCIKHLSLYLLKKKTVGTLINYGLGLRLSLFQQFLTKVKNQQIKWYQRLCIQYYKIKNMLGTVNRP